jgi:hypothetical protein
MMWVMGLRVSLMLLEDDLEGGAGLFCGVVEGRSRVALDERSRMLLELLPMITGTRGRQVP